MTKNLIVNSGTEVILDENPSRFLADSFQRINIQSFEDLVLHKFVSSQESLKKLLNAAQTSTRNAISSPETYSLARLIPGTLQPDLRRFAAYRAYAADVGFPEANIFWLLAKNLSPQELLKATLVNRITFPFIISSYVLKDIEVKEGGTLTISRKIYHVRCNNLIIRKTGKISTTGSLFIHAFSMQGNV